MRFRSTLGRAASFAALGLGAGCGGGDGDETHGVGDDGGRSRGGSAGVIGTSGNGGSAGTIPVTGGTTGNGATGNTAGTGGDMCATSTAMASPEAPVLMFLVDTSLSMDQAAPGSQASKWVETRDALETAFTSMRDGTGVGLIFYPNVPVNTMPCFDEDVSVPIAPLNAQQRTALGGALQMAGPDGSTPTHDAYRFALETLGASTLRGQKYVVLITDGIPTYALGCEGTGNNNQMPPIPTQPLVDESASAMAGGIRTFVIGSPGSEDARGSLSEMASVGGTAPAGCSNSGPDYCHLDMTTEPNFSTALNMALDEVIAGIPLTCDFNIPPPPAGQTLDLNRVNVTYTDGSGNSMDIGRDPSATECTTGWQYTENNTQITLCGELCDEVKADPAASISIVFGCQTRVNPPVL